MVREHKLEVKNGLRGGKGDVCFYHIETKEELCGSGRLFAKIVLPAGSSIGVHEHVGETEPYYIIKGNGTFIDSDGSKVPVKAGDCCLIKSGETHGLENNSGEDLELIALVHNVF